MSIPDVFSGDIIVPVAALYSRIDDLERQLSTARADGRADGLREAAKVCDQWPHHVSAQCADAIRALIPPQEK